MRLKFVTILGDSGYPTGAHLVNAESGDIVQGVRSVAVQCDIGTEFIPVMTVIVEGEIDITGIAHEILEAKR